MQVVPRAFFICALDGTPLLPGDGWIGCADGHRYDRAREGYFNLLPVQNKASRDPGDDKAMVAARRRVQRQRQRRGEHQERGGERVRGRAAAAGRRLGAMAWHWTRPGDGG